MSNVSLTANILTSKVITGNADRLQTYRIQDSDAMMCPVWNGQDLTGRQAGEYSFYTKRAGCNSAMDRIVVENFLRPSYTNFVTQNAAGIGGYIYETPSKNNVQYAEANASESQRVAAGKSTGHYGYGNPADGPYLPGDTAQELAGVLGHRVNLPGTKTVTAQAYAQASQKNRLNQANTTSFNIKNLRSNAPQKIEGGFNWNQDKNNSYFAEGGSRMASYAKESLFKTCT
jgi:hypothetical protein